MFYDFTGNGWSLPSDGPLVVNMALTNPNISVDRSSGTGTRLQTNYHLHAEVRMVKGGVTYRVPTDKDVSAWLSPSPNGAAPWLLDGWDANYTVGQPIPDNG